MASISVWVRFPEQQDDEAEEVEVPVGKSISWFKQYIIQHSLLKIKSLTDIESVSHGGQVLNNRNKIEDTFEGETLVITLVGKAVNNILESKKPEEIKARATTSVTDTKISNHDSKPKEEEDAKQEARRRLLEQKQESLRQKALERREEKKASGISTPTIANSGDSAKNNFGARAEVKSPLIQNSAKNNLGARAEVKSPLITQDRETMVRTLLSKKILDIKQQYGLPPSPTPFPISCPPVSTVLPKVKGVPTGLKKEHVKEDLTEKIVEIKKQSYSSSGKTFFPTSSKQQQQQSRPMTSTVQTPVVTTTTPVATKPTATTTPAVTTVPAVTTAPVATTAPTATTAPAATTAPVVTTAPAATTTPTVVTGKREVGVSKKTVETSTVARNGSKKNDVSDSAKQDKKDLEEARIAEEAQAAAEAHRKMDDVLRFQEATKAEQILKEEEMLRKQRGSILLATLKNAVLDDEGSVWNKATEEAYAKKRVINDEFDMENAKFYEESAKIEEEERNLRAQESQKPNLPAWKLRQWEEGIHKEQQKRADQQRRRQAEFISKRKMTEKRMFEEAEKHFSEALFRDSNSDFEASSHFYQLALIVIPDCKDYDDFYNRWTSALHEARKNSPSHQASTFKTQGDMATKTNDWKGAVEAYKQAVNLQPNRDDYKAALEEAEKFLKKQQQDTEAEEEERKLREVILQRKKDLEDQKRRMEEDLRRQEAEKQEREERRLAELKRLEEERMESERIKEEEEQKKRKEQEERELEEDQKRQEEAQRLLEESRKRQLLEDNERQRRREARKTALLSKDNLIPEGEEVRSLTSRKPRVEDDHKAEADEERPRRRHQRDAEGEDSVLLREPMTSREHSGKAGPSSTDDRRAEVARRRKARQEEEERIAREREERRKRRQQERGNNT